MYLIVFIICYFLQSTEVGIMYGELAQFLCHTMGNKSHKESSSQLMGMEVNLIKKGIPKTMINEMRKLVEEMMNTNKPLCIIAAGETVVKVKGSGRGGRCQELAIAFAISLHESFRKSARLQKNFKVEFLSAGTDGKDGMCDKAGAMVNDKTLVHAFDQKLHAQQYLKNNDSYTFFSKLNEGKNHLDVGLTGTNVMDMHILLIQPMLY